jgi:hypothetical protein
MSAGRRLPGPPETMHSREGVGGLRLSGDAVFLGVRMGEFVLCLHCKEGAAAMRVVQPGR